MKNTDRIFRIWLNKKNFLIFSFSFLCFVIFSVLWNFHKWNFWLCASCCFNDFQFPELALLYRECWVIKIIIKEKREKKPSPAPKANKFYKNVFSCFFRQSTKSTKIIIKNNNNTKKNTQKKNRFLFLLIFLPFALYFHRLWRNEQ